MNPIFSRILLAEDDANSGKLMTEFLQMKGFRVDWCQDGEAALQKYKRDTYFVVITDVEMPKMTGRELVKQIRDISPDQLIIVQTVHNEPEEIIGLMQSGAHDYLIKPIQLTNLLTQIQKTKEFYELKRYQTSLEKEKTIRLEEQLNWFKWVEEKKNKVGNSDGKENFFYNMRTSLTQGAGFGQLVTLVEKLVKSAVLEDGRYIVKPGIMDLIKENLNYSWKAIESFIEIDKLTSDPIPMEVLSLKDLHLLLLDLQAEMQEMIKRRAHTLNLSKIKSHYDSIYFDGNSDYLKKCFRELILNALKFSPPDSQIAILINTESDTFSVSILNPAITVRGNVVGIPLDYETIIFEPFYRIDHSLNSEYLTNELGLGLSFVRNVVKQHQGKIQLHNTLDHAFTSSDQPVTVVHTNVVLPVLKA
jgi:CheY-like chemotaxis protein